MPTFGFPDVGVTALRLMLSLLLCGAMGLERELHHRAAGFRTHILVGMGSCLIMMISVCMGGDKYDPARVAAQVVTGIGFLGAGTIIRHEDTVHGLTTAASVWSACAVGLAVGMGWYEGAAIATAMILVTLLVFRWLTPKHGQ